MKSTLITFHVGRGGRFHNAGHKTYSGTNETIDDVRGQIGDKHPSYLRYENIADVLKPFDNTPNFEKIRELIDNCENDNCYNFELLKYKITEENLGELIWVDSNGSQMMWENEDGTGSIDIDKEYNSYFVYEGCLSSICPRTSSMVSLVPEYVLCPALWNLPPLPT